MKILYVAHRLPWPPDKGDKIRSWRWLAALAPRHDLWLSTFAESRAEAALAGSIDLPLAGIRVFRRPRRIRGVRAFLTGRSMSEEIFFSRRLHSHVRRLAREVMPDVALGFSSTTARYLDGLDVPRVLDMVDFDSAKWEKYAERSRTGWVWRREAERIRALEGRILAEYDRVTVVSRLEADRIAGDSASLEVLPNGVDTERFRPDPQVTRSDAEIVFTGAMDYRPNVDAVCWFADEVLPRIREAEPRAVFTIVGSNPVSAVRELASRPGVTVTGTVPEVVSHLARARVAVAPLRVAMGIQNKVLEAMAAGLPVVASPGAAEGIDVEPGRHLVVADGAEAFAAEIGALLRDRERCERMGAEAREVVRRKYRWEPVMDRMEILLEVARR